ncbi:MAG: hypothetical protein PHO93_01735 [Candidatus Saccharimonadaceae bacterium]|nr:hypothetical protein [Candidatus Saccharimonadaceae bacterium]
MWHQTGAFKNGQNKMTEKQAIQVSNKPKIGLGKNLGDLLTGK